MWQFLHGALFFTLVGAMASTLISKVMATHVVLSDHSCVFYEMTNSVHPSVQKTSNQKMALKTLVNHLLSLSLPHLPLLGSQSMTL